MDKTSDEEDAVKINVDLLKPKLLLVLVIILFKSDPTVTTMLALLGAEHEDGGVLLEATIENWYLLPGTNPLMV
jgi:hypothetical protein